MNDRPYPVISAYIMSLKAAPQPVTKPYMRPLLSVLCTHKIPVGPIGADATIPIIMPFTTISSNDICATNCCKKSFCCKKSLNSFIITKVAIFYEIVGILRHFFSLFTFNWQQILFLHKKRLQEIAGVVCGYVALLADEQQFPVFGQCP